MVCNHEPLTRIRVTFSKVTQKLVQENKPLGRMYTIMLLRDPVQRMFSFIFFVRSGCPYRGSPEKEEEARRKSIPINWLTNRPQAEQDAVCNGDFESFLRFTPAHNEQADLLVGISYFQPNITEEQCETALLRLGELDAVLLNEEMDDSLRMMYATFKRPTAEFDLLDVNEDKLFVNNHNRPTVTDPLRDAIRQNDTLIRIIQELNYCDVRVYQRAKEIFEEGKRRLLGAA